MLIRTSAKQSCDGRPSTPLRSLVISVAWVAIASPGSVAGFSLLVTRKWFGSLLRSGIIIFDRHLKAIT